MSGLHVRNNSPRNRTGCDSDDEDDSDQANLSHSDDDGVDDVDRNDDFDDDICRASAVFVAGGNPFSHGLW